MAVPLDLAWFEAADGDVPTSARQPWALNGSGTASIDGSDLVLQSGDANVALFVRAASPTSLSEEVLIRDRLDIQAEVQVGSTSAYLAVIGVRDGARGVLLAIGNNLTLVDTMGTLARTIRTGHDKSRRHVYRLVKAGTEGFEVHEDGRLLTTLPYTAAPLMTDLPGFAWGNGPGMSGGTTRWRWVEAGVNLTLTPEWLIRQTIAATEPAIQRRIREGIGRHLYRALHGPVADGVEQARRTATAHTSLPITMRLFEGSGSALPGVDNDLSTVGNAANLAVVRERIRVAAVSPAAPDGVAGAWGSSLPGLEEVRVRATITMVQIDLLTHPEGFVGPMVVVREGWIYGAALVWNNALKSFGWRLVDVGNEAPLGESVYPVDPYQPHVVELYVWRGHKVMLAVDGDPVESLPVADFEVTGNTSTAHRGEVSRASDSDRRSAMDVEDVTISVRMHDLQRRPALLVRAAERLIPFGGCERNDELAAWIRLRHGVHRMRGTTIGIIHELRRISCGAVTVFDDPIPLSWYLNRTFPPPWPVYLNVADTRRSVQYGITDLASTMTAMDIARWAAFHLLPRSTSEAVFEVGVVQPMDGFTSGPTTSTSTYNTTGAAGGAKFYRNVLAGDTVIVRTPAGTGALQRTVTAHTLGSITVSPALPAGYTAGSTVYKTLFRS